MLIRKSATVPFPKHLNTLHTVSSVYSPKVNGTFADVRAICGGLEAQLHPFFTLGLDQGCTNFPKK
jgi:hypothetical protein